MPSFLIVDCFDEVPQTGIAVLLNLVPVLLNLVPVSYPTGLIECRHEVKTVSNSVKQWYTGDARYSRKASYIKKT